jgi:hypothetical protein
MAGRPSEPDLIKITEIFLVPSAFLVAALGTADTNPHRACVSLIGLIISGMWWYCAREAFEDWASGAPGPGEHPLPRRISILRHLSTIFGVGWLLSLVAHLLLWQRALGT